MQIPLYKSEAGLFLPPKSVVKDEILHVIHNTFTAEVREYGKQLEKEGFTCYMCREIPAGSKNSGLINLACTYIREDMHISMFFAGAFHLLTISVSAPTALPPQSVSEYKNRTPLSLTQCDIYTGMSYVVQNRDGSFILMDGGKLLEEDICKLYNFLKEKTPEGEKIRIALWMFSHADYDHVHLATAFVKKYCNEIDIDGVAYQFPDPYTTTYYYRSAEEINGNTIALLEAFEQYHPNTVTYHLHNGQRFLFPGVEVEILWTADQLEPHAFISANCTSSAWRLKFDNGKTALFLGDCMSDACRRIAHIYGDYLKSDILQVAHHGLTGGDKGLYQLIDPDICLWPTSPQRFNGTTEGHKNRWCLGDGECDFNAWIRDDSIRKREHYPLGETVTIMLD